MSFLSKKSWHVRSSKNQARVREAEEAAELEAKKTEQRRRELQEEREMETLRKLQGKAGASEGSNAMDWMYKTPVDVRDDKLQEEYLLGKAMPEKKLETVVEKVEQAHGSLFVKSRPAPEAAADLKAKMREDPLMLIKQREAQHIHSMNATQAHLHRIREQEIEDDHHRRRQKDEKKDSPKDKHKHKHKHKHRSHRLDDTSDDHDDRRKHKKRRHEDQDPSIGDSSKKPKLDEPSSSSSSHHLSQDLHTRDEPSRNSHQDPKDEIQSKSHHSETPTHYHDSRPPSSHSDRRYNGNGREYPTSSYGHESRQEPFHHRGEYSGRNDSYAPQYRSNGYSDRRRYDDEDEFGRRRREERSENHSVHSDRYSHRSDRYGDNQSYHRYDHDSGRYGGHRERYDDRRGRENRSGAAPGISEEERIQMLEQMQGRAKVLHHARSSLIEDSKVEEAREQAEHRASAQETQARGEMPSFVTKMNEEAIRSTSVEDRVSRGRFYMQKDE